MLSHGGADKSHDGILDFYELLELWGNNSCYLWLHLSLTQATCVLKTLLERQNGQVLERQNGQGPHGTLVLTCYSGI